MNDNSDITQSDFDALLAWLDPDREQAGVIYEQIRRRLLKIFECRGRNDAEELVDTTMNRVAKKVPTIEKDYVGDKALYFYGVAHNVFLESVRKRPPVDLPPPIEYSEEIEQRLECLDGCVLQLTSKNQILVLEYYQNDKRAKIEHRRVLAEKHGVGQNALRIRAYRIRLTLLQCVEDCLKQRLAV